MFISIDYEVTFPSTGRTFKAARHFSTGFGAVVGANEAGKSLILEFLRFSLFGTSALRGPSSDYRTLKVKTTFQLKGETYLVERGIADAKLSRGDEVLATGVKPVNQAVLRLLGFGLDVFDVSNCINQGDVERLGSMRPAERQKLVDSVVGLDKIEELARHAQTTAGNYEREASAMERVLVEPVRPEAPEGWRKRAKIETELAEAQTAAAEYLTIQGVLSAPRMVQPEKPTCDVEETVEELDIAMKAERDVRAIRLELDRVPEDASEEAIEAYERYCKAQEYLALSPAPTQTKAQLVALLAQHDAADAREEWERLTKDIAAVRAHIDGADRVSCPECDHEFPLHVSDLERRLKDLQAALPSAEPPAASRPTLTRRQIEHMISTYDEAAIEMAKVPSAPRPTYTREDVARRPELVAQLADLEPKIVLDADKKIARRMRYEADAASYEERLAQWAEQDRFFAEQAEKAEKLKPLADKLPDLRTIVARFAVHEQALKVYEDAQAVYKDRLAQIEAARTQGSAWRKAKDALGVLRTLIKQHLYPALASAASYYVQGMTGGQRRKIEISDTFEITVDGQALDTLSGSGKAVANLSIRLGLGKILTHSVFPVVLADEVDASMDAYRAEKTADIFQQCARSISQLLLVSHKIPEADYYIDLGGLVEEPAHA